MSNESTPKYSAAQNVEQTALIFAALSDSTRLQIVKRLSREGPLSISALAGETNITRQAVTKHLQMLETAELTESRREGRKRVFELCPEHLTLAHRYLNQIESQWDEALGRLQEHVEGEQK